MKYVHSGKCKAEIVSVTWNAELHSVQIVYRDRGYSVCIDAPSVADEVRRIVALDLKGRETMEKARSEARTAALRDESQKEVLDVARRAFAFCGSAKEEIRATLEEHRERGPVPRMVRPVLIYLALPILKLSLDDRSELL